MHEEETKSILIRRVTTGLNSDDASDFPPLQRQNSISPRQRWWKLSNVMKSINLMRHHTVRTLGDAESITDDLARSPQRTLGNRSSRSNYTKEAVNTVWWENRIYELCARGGNEALESIKKELDSDPKRHIWDIKDPDHLINRWGWSGQTPMYVACKNGHLEIVHHLMSRGADSHY